MPASLRIAYIANFSPKKLGTGENRLALLAREADARDHRICFFCHSPIHEAIRAQIEASGATLADLGDLSRGGWRSARKLSKDYDIIVLNMIAPRSRIALLAYAAWPATVLFVDHVSGPEDEPDYSKRSLHRRLLDALTMLRVHQVAGVSNYVEQRLQDRFSLPPSSTITLYGGVDTRRFHPQQTDATSAVVTITVVAALIPEKGVDVLLYAVADGFARPWRVLVVGDGPDLQRLQALATELGLEDKVTFLGLRNDADEILRKSDIFVHPATWKEALGYTILEGMASGCAVVASETGAIPELIEDGATGILFEPGSSEQLRANLAALVDDQSLREELAIKARRHIEENFDLKDNVANMFDWYESIRP